MKDLVIGGLLALGFGLVLTIGSQSIKFWEWSVNQAYNKGRAIEKVCAKEQDSKTLSIICTKHSLNTGHTIKQSIYE